MISGKRIKMRYAHMGGQNPPTIVIHGNKVDKTPADYRRYLENVFRKVYKLEGTPVRIDLKLLKTRLKVVRVKLMNVQLRAAVVIFRIQKSGKEI